MQNVNSELVMLAKKHDEKAMAELYEMTYSWIYASIRRVLHNDTDAQDILQDTYISAFKHLDGLKDTEKFNPWLYRIAINLCKNFLKKKKPMLFTDLEGEDGKEVEFADDRETFNPEMQADLSDTVAIFDRIFDSLPEDQRLCIVMYYRDEKSVADIAEILEISQNTVKSRLLYGRKKIQAMVEAMEKKGVKLYSAMPFLTWMLGKDFLDTLCVAMHPPIGEILSEVTGVGIADYAGTTMSVTKQAASTAQPVGTVAMYTAKASAFLAKTVVGKLTVGAVTAIMTGTVILGAAAGFIVSNMSPPEDAATIVETTEDGNMIIPEVENNSEILTTQVQNEDIATSWDTDILKVSVTVTEIKKYTSADLMKVAETELGFQLQIFNSTVKDNSRYAYNIYPSQGILSVYQSPDLSQADIDNAQYLYYSYEDGVLLPILKYGMSWSPGEENNGYVTLEITVVNLDTYNVETIFDLNVQVSEAGATASFGISEMSDNDRKKAYYTALKHLQSQGQALLTKGFEASIVEKTDGGILCMQIDSMSADVDNFGGWVELSRMICVCINCYMENSEDIGCYIVQLDEETFNVIIAGWVPHLETKRMS